LILFSSIKEKSIEKDTQSLNFRAPNKDKFGTPPSPPTFPQTFHRSVFYVYQQQFPQAVEKVPFWKAVFHRVGKTSGEKYGSDSLRTANPRKKPLPERSPGDWKRRFPLRSAVENSGQTAVGAEKSGPAPRDFRKAGSGRRGPGGTGETGGRGVFRKPRFPQPGDRRATAGRKDEKPVPSRGFSRRRGKKRPLFPALSRRNRSVFPGVSERFSLEEMEKNASPRRSGEPKIP